MVSDLLFQNSGRLRLEDFWEYKASLGYVGKPCLKNNKVIPNFSKSKTNKPHGNYNSMDLENFRNALWGEGGNQLMKYLP